MDDGSLRTLSIDMASCDTPVTGNPCTKTMTQGMHSIFSSSFAIWAVHVSRHSGMVVYGGEDGSIRCFQLTEKFMLSDRARAREPHFMCCAFAEDQATGAISIVSQTSTAPIQLKKSRADNSSQSSSKTPPRRAQGGAKGVREDGKRVRRYASKSLLSSARGKEIYEDQEALAIQGGSNSLPLVPFSAQADKSCGDNRTSVPAEANPGGDSGATSETSEKMPPKSISLHRLRWNQNKGCERWVCFGGAAGIARCQIIIPRT
jgi:general transcription factor 3C polypeptide 2